MKLNVVVVESHLRYNDSMRDTKHLESFARQRVQKEKEKTLFKNKIKAVHKLSLIHI